MSDIFISYAREDLNKVRKLASVLQSKGWDVFWDRSIPTGQRFRTYIAAKLNEAKCVVVAWFQTSIESDWVLDEAGDGLERNVLVPVLLERVKPPHGFRQVQTEDLSTWDGSQDFPAFQKLLHDIEGVLGGSQPGSSSVSKGTSPEQTPRTGLQPRGDQQGSPLQPGTVFRDTLKDGSQGPEMVIVPAGSFKMGDVQGLGNDNEKPVHTVQIPKPFAMGRYQVTFEEYDRFAQATRRELPNDNKWGRDRRPVIYVSWNGAMQYAKWLSEHTGTRYRLPTEAEWEYAARSGGKDETWAGTSQEPELGAFAWYNANSGDKTQPVGSKKPNALGLYDMAGNVWEWVQDSWHDDYKGAPTNGAAWEDKTVGQRVIRGGPWNGRPELLRSSFRNNAGLANFNIGFRLVQDIE